MKLATLVAFSGFISNSIAILAEVAVKMAAGFLVGLFILNNIRLIQLKVFVKDFRFLFIIHN